MTVAPAQLRRRMTLGEILGGSLDLYRRHFRTFLTISLVGLPFSALFGYLVTRDPRNQVLVDTVSLSNVVFELVVVAAVACAVAATADGIAPRCGSAYTQLLRQLGTFSLAILRGVGIVLLLFVTILGIPFAVYLAVRWAFFPQMVVLEGARAGEALSDSSDIVQGHWWRTFGILFVVWLLAAIIGSPATAINWTISSFIGVPLGIVIATLVLPFMGIAYTLLFFDLQSRERERVSTA
jgi:hypothetical protein